MKKKDKTINNRKFKKACRGFIKSVTNEAANQFIDELVNKYINSEIWEMNDNGRYPMCKDQPAQIDCRLTSCKHHKEGSCINISPAITLCETGTFYCWSQK
jgi:hypothetical protein